MRIRIHQRRSAGTAGYSLVEILIALSILGLVTAGTAQFLTQTSVMMFTSDQKLRINRDIRNLTNEMTDNARDANHFTIYPGFQDEFRDPPAEMEPEDYRQRDGESGDVLVLIFYGTDPNPGDNTPPPIERLVGYFRNITDTTENTGPVMKFDVAISGSDQNKKVEELVPLPGAEGFAEVIELSRGLANGRLFYNFRDRSIMVNGQIFHGNDAKRITDTYNFTISPRG